MSYSENNQQPLDIRFSNQSFLICREPVDEVLQMPPSLLTCGGCQQSIGDRFFLKAIEQYWHEDCLSCDLCGCRLGEVGRRLYYKLGRKLCRRDYLRFVVTSSVKLSVDLCRHEKLQLSVKRVKMIEELLAKVKISEIIFVSHPCKLLNGQVHCRSALYLDVFSFLGTFIH